MNREAKTLTQVKRQINASKLIEKASQGALKKNEIFTRDGDPKNEGRQLFHIAIGIVLQIAIGLNS